jgi:hypothetical protein
MRVTGTPDRFVGRRLAGRVPEPLHAFGTDVPPRDRDHQHASRLGLETLDRLEDSVCVMDIRERDAMSRLQSQHADASTALRFEIVVTVTHLGPGSPILEQVLQSGGGIGSAGSGQYTRDK